LGQLIRASCRHRAAFAEPPNVTTDCCVVAKRQRVFYTHGRCAWLSLERTTVLQWNIDAGIQEIADNLIATRRDFHAHPELGYQENRTAGIVAERLSHYGMRVRTGVGGTGVIGVLEGALPRPTLLVRADMDALPLQEENDVEYRSQNPGAMHACGHDGHTAMLLAVAEALSHWRSELRGTVKFVFQPAEEGGGGARRMIEDGAMDDPPVDAALACHLWNNYPVGRIGVRTGPTFACADRFSARIKGKGGHGAHPDQTVDPIVIAAQIITAFQSIVSRNVSPLETTVISVTSIHGGSAYNIIPESVDIGGTVRSFSEPLRDHIRQRMEEVLRGITDAFGAAFEFDYEVGYPPLSNDGEMADLVRAAATEVVSSAEVWENEPTTGGEDMAYFFQKVPGCMFLVGSANTEAGLDYPHHSPRFDIDERALMVGASIMLCAIKRYLTGAV